MPNRCTLAQRAQTENSFTSKHLPRSLRVIKTPLTGGLTAVGCVCVNVCPYPQGRNYIQNADAVRTPHKTQPWWRACRRIRDPPASNMHEHTSTLRPHRHTLEQRAYLQSANGEVEWETERGRETERERGESVRMAQGGGRKWSVGNRERERQRCTNHVCSLHCHHSCRFMMEQTVPRGRKITNEISGISQWFLLQCKIWIKWKKWKKRKMEDGKEIDTEPHTWHARKKS